jgi:hypothetical protein
LSIENEHCSLNIFEPSAIATIDLLLRRTSFIVRQYLSSKPQLSHWYRQTFNPLSLLTYKSFD